MSRMKYSTGGVGLSPTRVVCGCGCRAGVGVGTIPVIGSYTHFSLQWRKSVQCIYCNASSVWKPRYQPHNVLVAYGPRKSSVAIRCSHPPG